MKSHLIKPYTSWDAQPDIVYVVNLHLFYLFCFNSLLLLQKLPGTEGIQSLEWVALWFIFIGYY